MHACLATASRPTYLMPADRKAAPPPHLTRASNLRLHVQVLPLLHFVLDQQIAVGCVGLQSSVPTKTPSLTLLLINITSPFLANKRVCHRSSVLELTMAAALKGYLTL